MAEHRYGTHRSWSPRFPIGTKVIVQLGLDEKEVEAEVRGPLEEVTLRSSLGEVFIMKTVKMKVAGETRFRNISVERILSVQAPGSVRTHYGPREGNHPDGSP